jgi:Flp pilus assembly protein TadG
MRGIFGKLWSTGSRREPRTVLGRLRHDVRGNTLAIMAAGLLPFCGLVGGGIDLSRMYITKTRLQHACDAGALAGRKVMGSGTWGSDDRDAARQYFDANFTSTGMYGSGAATVAFAESAGKVTGTASATLPMTIMQVFGKTNETLTVTCDAEMRLPNTDIMFVLDTTGSMASKAVNSDPDTKIESLHTAVKCFYEIVARLDTDATCTTGTPSGGTGNQVQIRFGFMPYATNVNVGRLLPTSYFANSWPYQSRVARWWVVAKSKVDPKAISLAGVSQQNLCNDATAAAYGYNSFSETFTGSVTTPPYPTGTKRKVKRVDTHVTSWSGSTCYATQTTSDIDYELRDGVTPAAGDEWEDWRYGQITQPIGGLKNGTSWNSSLSLPIGAAGTSFSVNWDGCIEERQTTRATNYSPIPAAAKDLDIDLPPNQGDASTLWGPALPGVIFTRKSTIPNLTTQALNLWSLPDALTTANYYNNSQYFCPTEARKLQQWNDATAFDNYVDSLTPTGNTYHDIGMLWGARFISPTGLFATENALTSQGGEIDRNLIFMTDGDTVTQNYDYTAYGVPWFDRRQTPLASVPSAADLDAQVNARFSALCTAVKNKNITLWVISFGSGSNTATETRLSQCATTGRYFAARDSATLQATFASIANQISQLRLTR